MTPDKVYLVIGLLLLESHKDDWDEEIEHHECHEHDAGTNEQSTKQGGVVQDLANSASLTLSSSRLRNPASCTRLLVHDSAVTTFCVYFFANYLSGV